MPNDPTPPKIPGFRPHGKRGKYRAGVILDDPDARTVSDVAVTEGSPVATVLRRLIRASLLREKP